jgi:hypothetical protein
MELLLIIDEMEGISAEEKFELQMMLSRAKYVEEVMMENDTIPDFDFVHNRIIKVKEEMKCLKEQID